MQSGMDLTGSRITLFTGKTWCFFANITLVHFYLKNEQGQIFLSVRGNVQSPSLLPWLRLL